MPSLEYGSPLAEMMRIFPFFPHYFDKTGRSRCSAKRRHHSASHVSKQIPLCAEDYESFHSSGVGELLATLPGVNEILERLSAAFFSLAVLLKQQSFPHMYSISRS